MSRGPVTELFDAMLLRTAVARLVPLRHSQIGRAHV